MSGKLHSLKNLFNFYPDEFVFNELRREKEALDHQGTDWRTQIDRQDGQIYVTGAIWDRIQLGCHLHELGRTGDTEDYFDTALDSIDINQNDQRGDH